MGTHQRATEERDLAATGAPSAPYAVARHALVQAEQTARTDALELCRVRLVLDDDGDAVQLAAIRLGQRRDGSCQGLLEGIDVPGES